MARNKNAVRKHFIADVDAQNGGTPPEEFLALAKYISNITPEDEETIETEGFYDGDGTPEEIVQSIAIGYAFEGFRDPEDEAQNLVASKKLKTGAGRHVWHKVEMTDGTVLVGKANLSSIDTGSGEATSDETFSCTIKFIQLPEVTNEPVVEG